MLATDGVHEFVPPERVQDIVLQYSDDLDRAAQEIVQQALANGSDDNLTLQLVWVDAVPLPQAAEVGWQASQLPLPPTLCEGAMLDGYRMLRPLYQSSRSHVWLAQHDASGERVVLKVPTLEMQQDAVWLEHFMLEGWVARRLNNPHVLQAFSSGRPQQFLYNVFEYLEAQTLRQWMHDNPQPSLEQVRAIAGQLVKGLRAFHRQQMLHQDFRPDNIMIDRLGLVKIIDFGAVRVAGLAESDLQHHGDQCLGTVQYSAPEYFIGAPASMQSDMFSLAVVLYEMLCGQLPYGTTVGGVRSARHLKWLEYRPLHNLRRDIPPWLDAALRRALQPDPARRYAALSEFLQALHQPAEDFVRGAHRPLAERDPLLFWKGVSLVLMAMVWVLGLLLAVH